MLLPLTVNWIVVAFDFIVIFFNEDEVSSDAVVFNL